MLARLFEIGQDADGLREIGDGPALGEAEWRLIAEKKTAELKIATRAGKNWVTSFGLACSSDFKFERWRRDSKCGGSFIHEMASDGGFSEVSNGESDLRRRGQGRGVFPGAARFEVSWLGDSK